MSLQYRIRLSLTLPASIAMRFRRIAKVNAGPTKATITFTWANE